MERATNARAGRLVTSLNAALEQLSARLEGVVNDGLQVRKEAQRCLVVSLELHGHVYSVQTRGATHNTCSSCAIHCCMCSDYGLQLQACHQLV